MRSASQTSSVRSGWWRTCSRNTRASVSEFSGMAEEVGDRAQVGLAGGCSRNGIDDRDLRGNFIPGHPRSDVLGKFALIRNGTVAQFHHGDWNLAQPVVGSSDDRGALYRRVVLQHCAHI